MDIYKVKTNGGGAQDEVKDVTLNYTADKTTIGELRKQYAKEKRLDINRIELRIKDPSDPEGKKWKSLGDDLIPSGQRLFAKDLGPQVGYRLVFTVEYFGPLLIVLFFFLRPSFIYPAADNSTATTSFFQNSSLNWDIYNPCAKLGFICWMAHFLKRELESFFVHKFSRKTMPLFNIFKNCTYYYSFALCIGYFLCRPEFTGPANQLQINVGLAIFALSELGNFICHIMLSNLRTKEGSKDRPIPRGFLFELVACPNYTFEIMAWAGFSIMTNLSFGWVFTVAGLLQMGQWANDKHRGYLKDHGDTYKKLGRKRIIPFVW